MAIPQTAAKLSFADYLNWEEGQIDKHEFVRGEVFAMDGARREHVTVSLNLASACKNHLRGTPCRAYMADMKLRVEEVGASFYPDVIVTCDHRDHAASLFLSHPILLVEVLSDGTAAYDRSGKFADYRKLSSLQEYIIVDIDARRVECFRRNTENHWVLYDFTGAEACEFASIGLVISLGVVFEDVA